MKQINSQILEKHNGVIRVRSEIGKEIRTYIQYIYEHRNDFADKYEAYIPMLLFFSQMLLEKKLSTDERIISSMAQTLVGQIGKVPDRCLSSSDIGMYGGLGQLAFSIHTIKENTGELKETS